MNELPPLDVPKDVQDFLKGCAILVIDESRMTTQTIITGLVDLGANPKLITAAKRYDDAKEIIKRKKPQIVITEYFVEKKFGLDLLNIQKENLIMPEEKVFMMVTSKAEESIIAEAAEEDVDMILLKPFSRDTLLEYLLKMILAKVRPTDYRQVINSGKDHLVKQEFEPALNMFELAKAMESKPTLAHYYCGLSQKGLIDIKKAMSEFEAGLNFNPIHYKCLVGKFDILEELNDKKAAYDVVQEIIRNYPISPQLFTKIFKLAVHTQNFEDVETYYEIYKGIDRKTPELIKTVTGGLLVCGKFLLKTGAKPRATKVFRDAILSASLDQNCISIVVEALFEKNMAEEARSALELTPHDLKESEKYKIMDFKVTSISEPTPVVVSTGLKYIKQGIRDVYLFETSIQKLIEVKRKSAAEALAYKAIEFFPEEKARFGQYI